VKRILSNIGMALTSLMAIPAIAETAAKADQYRLNMTKGVTDISADVYDLHMLMFIICVVIAIGVFGVMFWSILFHRKSRGVKPAHFHESLKVEIAWTVVPFIILIFMAVPAATTLIAMEDASEPDLTIIVTGSQWKWHYKYMDDGVEYYSKLATLPDEIKGKLEKGENYLLEVDRPLVIPINKKVRFLVTSDDVIHSWWVPDFAVKQDANPGFINDAWAIVNEPGVYRGQCTELCGKDHGFMPVVVIAKEEGAYNEWLSEQKAVIAAAKAEEQRLLAMNMTMEEAMATGEKVYLANCAACHMPNGQGLPGVFPALKGSKIATKDEPRHIEILLNGVAGSAMQSYAKQLSMPDIAAVITYERNAWGNNTGDLVQAKDINAAMNGK
jgi:cytochrome c oxidase subunit II